MASFRFDPFRDALHLQNRVNSLLQDYAREGRSSAGSAAGSGFGSIDADTLTAGAFVPPVDILENKDGLVLTLEVPGIPQDALHISVENNTLSVRGERTFVAEKTSDKGEPTYHRVERSYGSFHRSFALPTTVDTGNVVASYDAGVLRIELGKRPETRSRKIQIGIGQPAESKQAAVPAQVEAPTPQHAN